MTWPFENDTGAIVKKLAKRSLTSEKRRNLMVVVAVALAAFLICLSATRKKQSLWKAACRRLFPAAAILDWIP